MGVSADAFPYTGPYSVDGNGRHKGNTALALKRAMSRMGHLPWAPEDWDEHYNKNLEAALDKWDPKKNGYAEGRWEKVRNAKVPAGRTHAGEWALDGECQRLVKEEARVQAPWSDIGPMFNGGRSLLQHDCTHATSGIPLYPALDDAFVAGTTIIAPEPIEVTRASSSNPGDAFYCIGDSGLRYWIAHLVSAPPVGRTFLKGQTVGVVLDHNVGGGPHVHVGVNVEELWGVNRQLEHKTNYTHGARLIGDQLADE